mmetsp:Transcript_11662/g.26902  ORF Transcript_11662/g.26902 Transcript_11662/m.26902 type:complete len:338 (+) Transcript_11662:1-1014(+)
MQKLEQAVRGRGSRQVSLAGLGLGPVYETLVVELGGQGQTPVQRRVGGGKRDVRRFELQAGASEVRVHLFRERGWRISDEAVPGVTEEKVVPLAELASSLEAAAHAPAPERHEFMGKFRHPTPADLEERAANVQRDDAAGLVGLWEWCRQAEAQDPGTLPPDMWAVYSADNNEEIERAFRDGALKANVTIGIRSYEVMFEASLASGKQVDPRNKKRRFVRRRPVTAEERQASLQAAESAAASAFAQDPSLADAECVICAEAFADTCFMPVVQLQCGHRFHGACVQDLADRRKTCPCCRAEVDWRSVREIEMLPASNVQAGFDDGPPPPPPPSDPLDI